MSWTLTLDIPIQRRRRIHQLRDEVGNLKASFQKTGEAIEWAVQNDIRRLEVISDAGHYLIDIEPFPF